ncbi:hypothetical protein F4805DRAFT_459466 [Annulohypoxylon moriforme]|nr:hypothetical protein F4805DRAFT_459466 [Annulohypoxylon moriforme]
MAFNNFSGFPSYPGGFSTSIPTNQSSFEQSFPESAQESPFSQENQANSTTWPNPFNPSQILGQTPSSQGDVLATDIEMTDGSNDTYSIEMDWEPEYPELDPTAMEIDHDFNNCFNFQPTQSMSYDKHSRNSKRRIRSSKAPRSQLYRNNKLRNPNKPHEHSPREATYSESSLGMVDIDSVPKTFQTALTNNKPQVPQSHRSRNFHTSYMQAALESHFQSGSQPSYNSQWATNENRVEGFQFFPTNQFYGSQ